MKTAQLSKSIIHNLEKSFDLFQKETESEPPSKVQQDVVLEGFLIWLLEKYEKEGMIDLKNNEISPIIVRLTGRIKMMLLNLDKKCNDS